MKELFNHEKNNKIENNTNKEFEWKNKKSEYLDFMQAWVAGKGFKSKGILRDIFAYDNNKDVESAKKIDFLFKEFTNEAIDFFRYELLNMVKYRKLIWVKEDIWFDDADAKMSEQQQRIIFLDEIEGKYSKSELDNKKNEFKERYKNKNLYLLTRDEKEFSNLEKEFFKSDFRQSVFKFKIKDLLEDVFTKNYEKFYITIEHIINNFSEYGTKKDIDVLLKFIINDDFSDSHIRSLADCMSAIDANYAAERLLENIKNPNLGEKRKQIMSSILLRLELGKINLNPDGLEYLHKKFDLGVDNGKFDFAQRLTVDGDIGFFKNKILEKYANIKEHLFKEEKVISLLAKEFVYDTLFVGSENENFAEKEKREKILKQFKENYYLFYDDEFFLKKPI